MKPLNATVRRGLACLLLACLPAAAGAADNAPEPAPAAPAPALPVPPDLNLRIERYASSIGSDGVQRETRYADLMYRRADLVWIERDYPAALRASVEHGHDDGQAGQDPHAGHSHANTTGSPLWVRRDAAGKDQVRMVLRKQHKVLDIDEANYGNVGYNGSWAATYGIADPRQLQRMQPDGAPAQGVQRYRQARGESQVLIDWDIQGQYARRIEIQGPHGLSVSKVTVTDAAAPSPAPWTLLKDYETGDYSDLLD